MSDRVPVNFICKKSDLDRFDRICRILHRNRSSVLNELMETFSVSHLAEIRRKSEILAQVDTSLDHHDTLSDYHAGKVGEASKNLSQSMDYEETDNLPRFFLNDGIYNF